MEETITSGQNPKIKELLTLQEKSRERRSAGLFVVEGQRELDHCLAAGFVPDTIFVCTDIYGTEVIAFPEGTKVFRVSRNVYEKIAYRGGTEGIIAEMKYKERKLEDIKLGENPLIVVLESVEKPGNLGAVLRSADAAGADAVIICDPLTDLYNPNLIRASIGAIFSRQVVAASSEETISWLKSNGIQILTAQLQDSSLYYDTPMTGPTAIVMGTESTGLTDIWRKAADKHIRIPMLGALDSLNVSVSAAILLFEAVRQRGGRFSETIN
ncbi:MAG: RNA methyltransferase [Bacteroidales bacterium]|nr:RNA methyltransferase [Bacteroidales bacterium]